MNKYLWFLCESRFVFVDWKKHKYTWYINWISQPLRLISQNWKLLRFPSCIKFPSSHIEIYKPFSSRRYPTSVFPWWFEPAMKETNKWSQHFLKANKNIRIWMFVVWLAPGSGLLTPTLANFAPKLFLFSCHGSRQRTYTPGPTHSLAHTYWRVPP